MFSQPEPGTKNEQYAEPSSFCETKLLPEPRRFSAIKDGLGEHATN